MNHTISTYCNTSYFPGCVALVNSLKYFGVQADIKIYDFAGFNHLLRSYIKTFAYLVDIQRPISHGNWWWGMNFKPKVLAANGLSGLEICLDSDIVILNNLESVFTHLAAGKFVASCEFDFHISPSDHIKQLWRDFCGKDLPTDFKVFNSGFVGLSESVHTQFVQEWAAAVDLTREQPLDNDQQVLSALLACRDYPIVDLPRAAWMNTWGQHGDPPKYLGFSDGKICMRDAKGTRIQLYHYTGGIGVIPIGQDKPIPARYAIARGEDLDHRAPFLPEQWYQLWEQRYNSPAAILVDYVRDHGPIKVPKVFSVTFREQVGRILAVTGHNPKLIDPKHPRVLATALVCDYIELLDYQLVGPSWMDVPVRMLLGKNGTGPKTIGWENDGADVSLTTCSKPSRSWFEAKNASNIESLFGLTVIINH